MGAQLMILREQPAAAPVLGEESFERFAIAGRNPSRRDPPHGIRDRPALLSFFLPLSGQPSARPCELDGAVNGACRRGD